MTGGGGSVAGSRRVRLYARRSPTDRLLGSYRNLRKITILLKALDNLGIELDYYALDLSYSELDRSLKQISPDTFKHVCCRGLLGTYDDGRKWLRRPENLHRPKCILSLGSTIGSFTRPEAAKFLSGFADALTCNASTTDPQHGVESSILVGVDACMTPARVRLAYNDPEGLNARFILNALDHANTLLGYEAFNKADWTVRGEWNPALGAHDQYLVPQRDLVFRNKLFERGKGLLIVHSFKYNAKQQAQLWKSAGLCETEQWSNPAGSYGKLAPGIGAKYVPTDLVSRPASPLDHQGPP